MPAEACLLRQVYVPSHPLVKHWLAVARNKLSPPAVFRGALAELGRLLIYEASAEEGWLPVLEGQAETPCGIADVTFLDPGRPVKASPPSSLLDYAVCRRQEQRTPLALQMSHSKTLECP